LKPHKHSELIKAWADGAEIETFIEAHDIWVSLDNKNIKWEENSEYRIKPEPKPDVVFFGKLTNPNSYVDAMWAGCHPYSSSNIKVVFNGETGELKSAEVLL